VSRYSIGGNEGLIETASFKHCSAIGCAAATAADDNDDDDDDDACLPINSRLLPRN